MSTTSLKLPDELKQRAVLAAEQQGVSPHAFMLSAIEQATTAAELRQEFINSANAARDQMLASGEGYDADDVRSYIQARIAGQAPARPQQKKWRA
ncbi:MAG: CopG family transcriptional regulator [Rhodocyclales bacterium]|nr:CopG family transcriptional regulator [Rhodocyclales bacterium]